MKTVMLIADGAGDVPCPALNNQSPLQAAAMPWTRRLGAAGEVLMVNTVPEGFPPGSDVANMGLLGYDARKNYTGRAPIEAAGGGIPMQPGEVAFRCNLVTTRDGNMIDHSAGHITDAEAGELVAALQEAFNGEGRVLHQGVSYRHLLLWDNGPATATTHPPHEFLDQPVEPILPSGEGSEALLDLLERSKAILEAHPVNKARVAAGKNPATQIWLWGQGKALSLESFASRYSLSGGIVTAVDLVRGLGVLAGLETPKVEGATGFIDTNYEGKVEAAMKLLEDHNFAYVHIEAPDECGHLGEPEMKRDACSAFDAKVVGPIWEALEARGEPYQIVVTMDHRTPCHLRGHSAEPVPMAILCGPVPGGLAACTEEAVFDETVNGGVAQVTTWDWVQDNLSP